MWGWEEEESGRGGENLGRDYEKKIGTCGLLVAMWKPTAMEFSRKLCECTLGWMPSIGAYRS